MKALIQAEATILGFFGIIVVYVLKSLDDQLNIYRNQWFKLADEGKHTEVDKEVSEIARFFGLEVKTKAKQIYVSAAELKLGSV